MLAVHVVLVADVKTFLTFCSAEKFCKPTISISGLVVEYIVAIDVTRVRFPADALLKFGFHSSRKSE